MAETSDTGSRSRSSFGIGASGCYARSVQGLERFHMNEGMRASDPRAATRQVVPPGSRYDSMPFGAQCVFTTHTPVPAGHDQFSYGFVREVLGEIIPIETLQVVGARSD